MPEISVTQIVKTVESEEEQVREFVEENELSEEDLEKLLEAEKAAGNREEVIEFLKENIREQRISEELEKLDDDLEGVEELMDGYRMEEEEKEMPQDAVLQLVGGTVDEMVEHLEEHSYSPQKLEELLKAEKTVKNRKTAKRAIEREIEDARIGEDAETIVEDAEKLEDDMESLEEDMEETSFSTDDDFRQKLKNELDEIQESEDDDIAELAEAIEEKESEGSDESSEDQAEETSEDENDVEDVEEDSEEPEDEEIEAEGEQDELEQKKDILEDLDVKMNDEELEKVSLGELKDLREEKDHREELIEELSDEFDESMLRNASTSDLEKLANRTEDEAAGNDPDDSDDEEVDEEKLQKEAQEELEMLMGANRKEEDEEEDKGLSLRQRIGDTRSQIRDSLPFSDPEEDSEESETMDAGSVQELLESYRDLESKQATVKTAHVMKAFLEQKLNVDREMTYKELAERMEEESSSEQMQQLADTFRELHRDQYMGNVSIDDVEQFIDNSKSVAEELG